MIARARALDPERVDWFVAACLLITAEVAIWTHAAAAARVGTAVWGAVTCGAGAVRRRWLLQYLGVAVVVLPVLLACYGSAVMHPPGTVPGVVGSLSALLLFYGGGAFLEGRRSLLALAFGVALVCL